jgi:ubiquinone/menaquinone biosynthesis C-methylase UbiE
MIAVSCNLCGRQEYRVRFPATVPQIALNGAEPDVRAFRCTSATYGSHPRIVECAHCHFVYANPRWPSDKLIAAYAAVEDETYVAERAGRELTFRRHLRDLERFTGPPNGRTLLDVGAYIGVFVEVAQETGWQATGVEPSAWAAGVGQRRGLRIIEGTLNAPELRGKQFDVITLWDVIEHLDDPAAELGKVYRLLRPGGLVAVHTMDVDSLAARLMGRRWPWLMDMHLHYFSRRTLGQMLAQADFIPLKVGPQGRYLRLNYLATRLEGLSRAAGWLMSRLVRLLRLGRLAVPVNIGDLITAYAQKPDGGARP